MSKIQCTSCNDIIESKHRYDCTHCKCKDTFIDGGDVYLRYGFKKEPPIIIEDVPKE
jgi:hypothetical protein